MTDPEPPRPPGVPDLDLDLPIDTSEEQWEAPPDEDDEDVEPGAASVEPTG